MYTQIAISWLRIQAFCEYQLYLAYCRGVGNLSTPYTMTGTKAHAALDSLAGPGEVGGPPLVDRISQAKVDGHPFIAREVDVHGARVNGRIDCIEYHLEHVDIIDNKPRPKTGVPFYGDKRQILAYCMAFAEEFPDNNVPIFARLKDHSDVEFWSHKFVESDKADVNDAIDRILGILNETRKPFPTSNDTKCSTCHYLRHCDGTSFKGGNSNVSRG